MKCELCGSEKNSVIATKTRDGGGNIVKCDECGLIFQDYNYSLDELQKYYNEDYVVTNSLGAEGAQSPKDHFDTRLSTLNPIRDDLIELIRNEFDFKPRILELGASAGELLYLLADYSDKLVGIELNEDFCDWANENLPDSITMIPKDINELEFEEKFDLIISNYTLDHLPNPLKTLRKMVDMLSDDGVMYLTVPNRDEALNYFTSPDTKGKYQTFFWHKAHMFYFTRDTYSMFLNKCGLEAELSCFHQYSLRNFLQWYYVGKPGLRFDEEVGDVRLFMGNSNFENQMNELMEDMDTRFREIMCSTWGGGVIKAIARKKKN